MGFAHSEGDVMAEGLLPGQRHMPDRWLATQTAAVALPSVLEFGTASVAVPQIDWGVRATKPDVPRPFATSPTAQRSSSSEWQTRFVNNLGATPLCLGRNHARVAAPASQADEVANRSRRHFVQASILLTSLVSFAVGACKVGFNLFGSQTLGLTTATMAAMLITCSLAMLAAQSMLLLLSVLRRVDQRWVAAAFAGSALALAFTSLMPDAGSLGLMIDVVSTIAGMVGPVLSYELLERKPDAPGTLPGRKAAAGNLGQALFSMSAGSLLTSAPMAPFWTAAAICWSELYCRWSGGARSASAKSLPWPR